MSDIATYLYCVMKAPKKAPSLAGVKGLPGAGKPRLLDAGRGLKLVVADAPLDRYGEGPIAAGLKDLAWVSRCAVAHEAVVEHAAKGATVVPTKLFTLFASDESALAHVKKERSRIDRVISRITGCEEYGVRIRFDEARALRAAKREVRAAGPADSGTGFLVRKKKITEAVRSVARRAGADVEELHERLAKGAADARRRAPERNVLGGAALLLDAAYLVPRKKVTPFKRTAAALAKELAPEGYDVSVTGPWPPYNFVSEGP